ncbi:MAG: M1 family aminopeptidase [Pseudomonadota bacterium]
MPSVEAHRFTALFRKTFAEGGRVDGAAISRLQQSARSIDDPGDRAQAESLLKLVQYDRELDDYETAPARKAMASLLGVTAQLLPAELEQVLAHAVPSANVTARHYELNFDFSADGDSFPARARIDLDKPVDGTAILEVDSERLAIASVLVDGKGVPYSVADNRLHVEAPGASSIEVRYAVTPTTDTNGYGLIRDRYTGACWTLLWPDHTGALFPSNASPADGATATVTVRVGPDRTAIGPGAVDSERFHLDREVPAYAVALYTGKKGGRATATSESGVTVTGAELSSGIPDHVREAYVKSAAEAVDYFSSWLGPYAFGDTLNLIEVKGDFGGMENAGAISMMVGSNSNLAFAKRCAIHETAHHWFGDNVRVASYGDLWISEGFADYIEARCVGHLQGEGRFQTVMDEATRKIRSAFREGARGLALPPTSDPLEVWTSLPYSLGCWMLRSMESRLGRDVFDPVLREWYATHKGKAASSDDLMKFVEGRTGHDFAPLLKAFNGLGDIPRLGDRSRVEGQRLLLRLDVDKPVPDGLEIPVELRGRDGEKKLVWVDPNHPEPVDAGFAITGYTLNPDNMALCEVR